MNETKAKPWEGPGVGYTESDIHPVRKVLMLLQDEMLPEDLVTFTTLLKVIPTVLRNLNHGILMLAQEPTRAFRTR